MSYVDMVEVLLGLVRASREGNWQLHLLMIKEMIPWSFAYDRHNYARYLPVYYRDMARLEIDHPQDYNQFISGGFSVQLGPKNPFGRVPVDQAIKETTNRDTQAQGGTKGFSLNAGAVMRYYVTAEYRSTCLRNLREMTSTKASGLSHADLQPSRITRDEKDVQSITDTLESSWINPFSPQTDLMSI